MSSQAPNYDLTLVDRIINLIRNTELGGRMREFYYGDPIDIPTDSVPCFIAELQNTNIIQGPTGMDFVTQEVLLKIVINIKSYYDIQGDNEMAGQRALEEMAQGLNPATSQYDATSIVGIIRQNFTLVNFATNQTMQIKYGVMPRGEELVTSEVHIRFIVENFQMTPNKV